MIRTAVILVSSLLFSSLVLGHHHSAENDEYGPYGKWNRALCERLETDIIKDSDECFKNEVPVLKEAIYGCMKQVAPITEGDSLEFFKLACNGDKTLFAKNDECYRAKELEEKLKSQMELSEATLICLKGVLDKYDMGNLEDFMDVED